MDDTPDSFDEVGADHVMWMGSSEGRAFGGQEVRSPDGSPLQNVVAQENHCGHPRDGDARVGTLATVVSPLEPVGYVSIRGGLMIPALWNPTDGIPPSVGESVLVTVDDVDPGSQHAQVVPCQPRNGDIDDA